MPPLNQFLPKLATDSLKKANVHSTIDLLNADNTTLLHALQDEQIRESLLLFLIQDNHNNDQNASNIDSANVTTNTITSTTTTTSTTTVTFNHEINNNNNNRVMANIPTLQTTASHASISPIKLVQLLKKYIITLCTSPGINAKELLKKQRSRFFIIKSGMKDIDKYLNGGIAAGTVTEINGRAGSGKTYFCLRIAANTLLDDAFANVCYIDTKHSFSPKRFENICKDLSKDRTMQTIIPNNKHYSMLKRLIYFQAYDIYAVFDLLNSIKKQCDCENNNSNENENGSNKVKQKGNNVNIKVLILDSVTSIGRPMIGSGYGGHALLMHLAQEMKEFAVKYGIAVLITNATVSDQKNNNKNSNSNNSYQRQDIVKAALGKVWQFVPDNRVIMNGV